MSGLAFVVCLEKRKELSAERLTGEVEGSLEDDEETGLVRLPGVGEDIICVRRVEKTLLSRDERGVFSVD